MFSIRNVFYLLLGIIAASCNKDNAPPEEPVSCNSVTLISPDTNAVLFVVKQGSDYAIHQLKSGVQTPVISQTGYDFWWPRYSPDKQFILCYRSPGNDAIEMGDYTLAELWKFNADGTGGHMILKLSDFGWNATGYAQWTPDGKKIVMAALNEDLSDNNNLHWHLYVTDTAGNNPQKISTRASYFVCPDVSPDFSKITYCAYPSPLVTGTEYLTELHVATLDTNTWTLNSEVRITNNNRVDDYSSFSPDGSLITWNSYSANGDYKLHTSSTTGVITDINPNGRVMRDPVFKTNGELFFILRYGTYCLNHIARTGITGSNEMIHYRKTNTHFYQPEQ